MPAHKDEIVTIITPEVYREIRNSKEVDVSTNVPLVSSIVEKAKLQLPVNAARTLRVLYALISPNDPPGLTYRFDLESYAKAFNIKTPKLYTLMKDACTALRTNIELPISRCRVTGLISTAQVTDNEVEITIDPVLLKIYQSDKGQFSYRLQSVQDLAYGITFKMYELCRLKLGSADEVCFQMDLADLKEYLLTRAEYSEYRDFKRRVLNTVVYDINGIKPNATSRITENNTCDIHVDYSEIKEKRKVVAIAFNVKRIRVSETLDVEAEPIEFFATLTLDEKEAYDWLRSQLHVAHSTIRNCIDYYRQNPEAEGSFLHIYRYIVYYLTHENKVRNRAAWAAKCLRERYYLDVDNEELKPRERDYTPLSLPENQEMVTLLNYAKINNQDRQLDIITCGPNRMTAGRIRANVDYVNHKYADKSDNERMSLLFKAIMADYAGYDLMVAEKLAEEKRLAHEKEVKDNIKKLSDTDLEFYKGEFEDFAKEEFERRMEEKQYNLDVMADYEYDKVLKSGNKELIEEIKNKTIDGLSAFLWKKLSVSLQGAGISEDPHTIEYERLSEIEPMFPTMMKRAWKKEFIEKNPM